MNVRTVMPIAYGNKLYYNRYKLKQLGITEEEIRDYFDLTAIKVVIDNKMNKLNLVEEYHSYINFQSTN